jgi:hypothetical protein
MDPEPIAVEILHTPGCGHWGATRDAVLRVAAQEGIVISLTETTVATVDEAVALCFPGSPTVRVRDRDRQADVEQAADFGLG